MTAFEMGSRVEQRQAIRALDGGELTGHWTPTAGRRREPWGHGAGPAERIRSAGRAKGS